MIGGSFAVVRMMRMVLIPCEFDSTTSPDAFVRACGEPDDTAHMFAVAVADDDVVDAAGRAMLAHDAASAPVCLAALRRLRAGSRVGFRAPAATSTRSSSRSAVSCV